MAEDGGTKDEAWWKKKMDEIEWPSDDEELDIESRTFPEAEQPADLATPLLPFQRESLYWMTKQEHSGFRGGILADEMGLGKTIQAIALIIAQRSGAVADAAAAAEGATHAPQAYESEGIRKERSLLEKEAAKARKLEEREAAKAAKQAAKDAAAAAKATGKKGKGKAAAVDTATNEAGATAGAAGGVAAGGAGTGSSGDAAADAHDCHGDHDCSAATASAASSLSSSASASATAASSSVSSSSAAGAGAATVPAASKWSPLIDTSSPLDHLAPDTPCSATLVVCPVVALTQWRSEILRHARPGALTVHIHHGANRTVTAADLSKFDVVLTTYSILEAEFRKMMEPNKTRCQWCGKLFLPEKMAIHLRYFCGPDAQKTAAQAKQERKADGGGAGAARGWRPSGGGSASKKSPSNGRKAAAGAGSDDGSEEEEWDDDASDTSDEGSAGSSSGSGSDSGGGAKRGRNAKTAAASDGKRAASASSAGGKRSPGAASSARSASAGRTAGGAGRKSMIVVDDDDDDDDDGTTWFGASGGAASSPAATAAASAGAASASVSGVKRKAPGSSPAGAAGATTTPRKLAGTATAKRTIGGAAAAASAGSGGKGKPTGTGSAAKRRKTGSSDDDGDDSDFASAGGSSSDSDDSDDAGAAAARPHSRGDVFGAADDDGDDGNGDAGIATKSRGASPSATGGAASGRKKASPSSSAAGGADAGGASSSSSAAGMTSTMKLGPLSVLQRIHWRRVVLDEAHAIKNKRCATARAAFALTAQNRWCLSGTPLQNRVAEMFSLVRFLRIQPHTNYFCKNCPCSSMDYRINAGGRECELCGHSPLRHYNWLNRYVMNPIKQFGMSGPGRDAMLLLRREVLDGVLLRRTKTGRAKDLALPTRTIVLRDDLELDAFENDFYVALYTQSKARFGAYVTAGTVLSNYAHLFDLLTRLRQAVNHPYLILHGNSAEAAAAARAGLAAAADDSSLSAAGGVLTGYASMADVCGICRESVEDRVVTGCRHAFCRLCMVEYLQSVGGRAATMLKDKTNDESAFIGGDDADGDGDGDEDDGDGAAKPKKTKAKAAGGRKKASSAASSSASSSGAVGGDGTGGACATATCPTCFAPLTVDLMAAPEAAGAVSTAASRKSILSRIPAERVGSGFRSSTKIEALLEDLWKAQQEEPGVKAIVFSQFVNMLDLIQHRLTHAGVRCVKLDGGMTVAARDRVITAFREDPHVTVFLISLKAGGVALNLTAASRLYLMDPWWNPSAEHQAMDRTHRLGQHRSITIVRFIVRNTIEEKIVALQEKKRLVFDATVGQDTTAMTRLTEEDMRFLFS